MNEPIKHHVLIPIIKKMEEKRDKIRAKRIFCREHKFKREQAHLNEKEQWLNELISSFRLIASGRLGPEEFDPEYLEV